MRQRAQLDGDLVAGVGLVLGAEDRDAGDDGEQRGDARGRGQPAGATSPGLLAQRGQQRVHARPALLGLGRERPREDLAQPRRHARALGRLPDHTLGHGERERGEVVGDEGARAVQRLVERDGKGELIAGRSDLVTRELLGGHVRGRAQRGPGRGQIDVHVRALELERDLAALFDARFDAREAEVHDPNAPVLADHHVVGLEVAVHAGSLGGASIVSSVPSIPLIIVPRVAQERRCERGSGPLAHNGRRATRMDMVAGYEWAHGAGMGRRVVVVRDLIFMRWETLDSARCAELRRAAQDRVPSRGRTRLYHIALFPHDMPTLGDRQRQELVDVSRAMLSMCAHVSAVVEASGPEGASLRRTLSGVRSAEARHYGLSIVNSLERALRWAPGPLPPIAELEVIFDVPAEPARRVA